MVKSWKVSSLSCLPVSHGIHSTPVSPSELRGGSQLRMFGIQGSAFLSAPPGITTLHDDSCLRGDKTQRHVRFGRAPGTTGGVYYLAFFSFGSFRMGTATLPTCAPPLVGKKKPQGHTLP